jgi:hypothetical protein
MTDTPEKVPGPETQKQRWMKYGANVALVSVVVVLLAVILTAIAQQSWAKLNLDTTKAGLYSLKPQTKVVLKDLPDKVRIVSLYTATTPRKGQEKDFVDYATPVADLLEEYQRYGNGKVEVEVIDPAENPGKVDALIEDVTQRYGGEVKQYRDFLDSFDKTGAATLRKLLADESAHAAAIDQAAKESSELGATVGDIELRLRRMAQSMDDLKRGKERMLSEKPPDYKGAAGVVRKLAEAMSSLAGAAPERLKENAADPQAAPAVKKYVADSAPRFAEMKKQADAVAEQAKKLGELKLDDLSQTLQARDSIVVLGPRDMRVLSRDQVWQLDPNVRRMVEQMAEGQQPKERFAGEQQITSAILALTKPTKPKIAIVRSGGQAMAEAGGPFGGGGGPLSQVAARLREYNFDVVEKDLSGAPQAPGMPRPPEPSEEEIKDAIWLVVGTPPSRGEMMGAPPSAPIAPKLQEHLKRGGSAMVLLMRRGEDLSPALAEFGIKTRADATIVHEPIAANEGAPGDMVNEAQRNPYIFIVNQYGEHALAQPVNSLDMPLLAAVPVTTEPQKGVQQWNLLPVPTSVPAWGETNASPQSVRDITFDEKSDVPGPLFAGAAAQKDGAGRVLVLGTFESFTDQILNFPDVDLLVRQRVFVTRFPGAGELFTNGMFWLAKMEPMIAISPAAMEVSRIKPMSKGMENFWRTGVLMIGLPLLVVLAGGLMYVRRRD